MAVMSGRPIRVRTLAPRSRRPRRTLPPHESSCIAAILTHTSSQDLAQWYATLKRRPETWTVDELATWAALDDEHGGAGLPWLADKIREACIDGDLLMNLDSKQRTQLKHSVLAACKPQDVLDAIQVWPRQDLALLPDSSTWPCCCLLQDVRPVCTPELLLCPVVRSRPHRSRRKAQAVRELRRLGNAVAAGEVVVPVWRQPPVPPPLPARDVLLQGRLPPRRPQPLPWDQPPPQQQQAAQQAQQAGAAAPHPTRLGYPVHLVPSPGSSAKQPHHRHAPLPQAATAAPSAAGAAAQPAAAATAGGGAPLQPPPSPGGQARPSRAQRAAALPRVAVLHRDPLGGGRRVSLSQAEAMLAAAAALAGQKAIAAPTSPPPPHGSTPTAQPAQSPPPPPHQAPSLSFTMRSGQQDTASLAGATAAAGVAPADAMQGSAGGWQGDLARLGEQLEHLARTRREYDEARREHRALHNGTARMHQPQRPRRRRWHQDATVALRGAGSPSDSAASPAPAARHQEELTTSPPPGTSLHDDATPTRHSRPAPHPPPPSSAHPAHATHAPHPPTPHSTASTPASVPGTGATPSPPAALTSRDAARPASPAALTGHASSVGTLSTVSPAALSTRRAVARIPSPGFTDSEGEVNADARPDLDSPGSWAESVRGALLGGWEVDQDVASMAVLGVTPGVSRRTQELLGEAETESDALSSTPHQVLVCICLTPPRGRTSPAAWAHHIWVAASALICA